MDAVQPTARRARPAGADPALGRRWRGQHPDRRAGRRLAPDRHRLPAPLRAPRTGWASRPTPARPAPERAPDSTGRDLVGHPQPTPSPARGITHWSTRLLARELGVSRDTVARIWR